jgi:signal transduction histidine kinase
LTGLSQILKSRRIGTQIAVLVVTSLLIAQAVTAATFLLLGPPRDFMHPPEAMFAKVAVTAKLIASAPTAEARQAIIAAAPAGFPELRVETDPPPAEPSHFDARFVRAIERELGQQFAVFATHPVVAHGPPQIGVRLPDGSAIMTAMPPPPRRSGLPPALISALAFLACAITLLFLWAARTLTAPLAQFADAAERFTVGRSDAPLSEQGPAEIRRAAKALNGMRARIRQMVEDRTRMLAAVSHDLRTPITRLRLRAEEIAPETLKQQVIRDLDGMADMVHAALSFLRDQATGPVAAARQVKADLPSLIQTLCDGFGDMGAKVTYSGPAHLQITCDPEQLTRALSNLVDNAVKFGSTVTVELTRTPGGPVTIEVADDGPGIAEAEREKVMEPFYRGDTARGLDGKASFGLGLSIARSVAQAHGGTLTLCGRSPKGLIAHLTLPPA